VRVVTYNIRGFRDGRGRVADVVRAIAPDVLLLQETGSRRALRRLAADVEMRVAHDPWSPLRRRVKNAVLLAEPWRFRSIELKRFEPIRRWYPRGALVARAVAGPNAIWAISTHFGLGGPERAAQAASLTELLAGLGGGSVIVGGDLNATPDMRAVRTISAALGDAWAHVGLGEGATFPAFAPAARIDYVFVGGATTVVRAAVGAEGASRASDHLPVVVEVRLTIG
jgi:endonuclease/exonuclease/phosphatase family metal-dependent hydrolase